MMKSFATLVRAAAASLLLATGANAAIVVFDIDNAGSGATIACPDGSCNFTVTPAAGQPDTINVDTDGSATTFNFLSFNALSTNDIDSFTLAATLKFVTPLASFLSNGVPGTIGTILGPSPSLMSTTVLGGGRLVNGSVVWDAIAPQLIPGVGLVTVFFADRQVGPFVPGFGPRNFVVEATISLQPIPLPAGILLLGSALLGLFGLSRRRKLASA